MADAAVTAVFPTTVSSLVDELELKVIGEADPAVALAGAPCHDDVRADDGAPASEPPD